ncbi:conjugal transfer protein TraD [Sphingomonas sp. RT2P30]|uniref:conjugal transfer protein TraD n=1 Tax=Parasphingomonas halimpatiens TaxID=3096162 RepID=UPI002FC6CB44
MRKPRDFDSELKTLTDKARLLKERKVHQLGELVIATGADALSVEQLAGLLLAGVENKESNAKESWRKRGAAFFQRAIASTVEGHRGNQGGASSSDGGTPPPGTQAGTN